MAFLIPDDELIALVRDMRAKQKLYFRTRNATILAECKDLERRVDAELARRAIAEENAKQPTLF